MQALKSELLVEPLALALGLPLGAAELPPVPGAWAQPAINRVAAPTRAGRARRDFFTYCLQGLGLVRFHGGRPDAQEILRPSTSGTVIEKF
jgi:hypothetical protein